MPTVLVQMALCGSICPRPPLDEGAPCECAQLSAFVLLITENKSAQPSAFIRQESIELRLTADPHCQPPSTVRVVRAGGDVGSTSGAPLLNGGAAHACAQLSIYVLLDKENINAQFSVSPRRDLIKLCFMAGAVVRGPRWPSSAVVW